MIRNNTNTNTNTNMKSENMPQSWVIDWTRVSDTSATRAVRAWVVSWIEEMGSQEQKACLTVAIQRWLLDDSDEAWERRHQEAAAVAVRAARLNSPPETHSLLDEVATCLESGKWADLGLQYAARSAYRRAANLARRCAGTPEARMADATLCASAGAGFRAQLAHCVQGALGLASSHQGVAETRSGIMDAILALP